MRNKIIATLLSIIVSANSEVFGNLESKLTNLIETNVLYSISAKPSGPITYEEIKETIGINNPFLVIDKSKYKLYLIEYNCIDHPCDWDYINQYDIAIGRKDGDKKKEGDNKTPEGIYKIIKIETKFGGPAFRINYPNKEDNLEGKTGNGILIHMTNENKIGKKVTHGCIGLAKNDIYNLKKYIDVGTKVIVMPDYHL
ncbi:MAG: L,D-transpeptidase [Nanoarchaeota archaeon]|nr:L,D-transpeptidase [Nanoarchaeota archaeon]